MDDLSGSRLAAILKNVISAEINLRTADLATTEQNINTVREYLNKTRQAVCADFYDDNFKTTLQKPAHRAVKKTFAGKTPIKQEPVDHFAHSSSSGWSSDSQLDDKMKTSYENCATIKKEPSDVYDSDAFNLENMDAHEDSQPKYLDPDEKLNLMSDADKRRPRYIPPVIPVTHIQHSLKPRGNKAMKKVRFLVRNNSKYMLTPEDNTGATHKWSLNVKLNDESMDISQIVSKVVFYLHPSYKPHDVVTVNSAPFKITRKGWGEFDLRIKMFFKNEKNEPVAVTHQLIFDKLHSGMETFGGETIFDHWINDPSESAIDIPEEGKVSPKGDEKAEQPVVSKTSSFPTLPTTTFDDLSSMPFTNETSKHFLSAIFGEPEELSAVKKDWEQFDNLFNLDDLAFPEFLGSGVNDPKLSSAGKLNLKVDAAPEKVTDAVLDENSVATQSISAVASNLQNDEIRSDKNQCPVEVNSFNTDLNQTVPIEYGTDETHTSKPERSSVDVSLKEVTSVDESSLKRCDVDEPSGSVAVVKEELYLSDLSEFGDEVIITDSSDSSTHEPVEKVEEQILAQGQNLPECVPVDYSSVEMDDLIKFSTDKPSTSKAQPKKLAVDSCTNIPSQVTATYKEAAESPNRARQSGGNVKAHSVLETGSHLVTNPPATLLVTSANLASVVTTKCVINSSASTMIVSSSDRSSIVTPVRVLNSAPTTLLVSSSSLSSITSPKCLPTSTITPQKTGAKNPKVIKKVAVSRNPNTNIVSSITSVATGSPVSSPMSLSVSRASLIGSTAPVRNLVTSVNPVTIKTDGQPITLLPVISTSTTETLVSKTAPIVISSPRVCSQATPTLLVPSSMILKSKPNTNAVVGQLNNSVPLQASPLAPKPKGTMVMVNNKISPTQVNVCPGRTRYMVRMPDGTLKPINLESLTPLKPAELKFVNPVASGSQPRMSVPQPVLVKSQVANSVVPTAKQSTPLNSPQQLAALKNVAPRGKRALPPNMVVPAKKRKLESGFVAAISRNVRRRPPIILSSAPKVVFKVPRSPDESQVAPQATSQQNTQVTSPQNPQGKPHSSPIPILIKKAASPTSTAASQLRKPAAAGHPTNLIPKPEGMSILKRRPPETEVDARSLIEQCPRHSIEVSICWLLKKFPIVHFHAEDESFKQAFPYCAVTTRQFNHWPLAKRRAHELLRAIDVLRVAKQIYPTCAWTKLDVVQFARLRGFTPLMGKINPSAPVYKPPHIEDVFTLPDTDLLSRILESCQQDDEDVDVTSIGEDKSRSNDQTATSSKKRKPKMFQTLKGHLEDARVVEQLLEQVSIYPEPEEIAPRVTYPAVLRVMVSAFHSFAEDLIRRAYSSSYLRHGRKEPRTMVLEDVQVAIFSREEFDIFTNQGLGTRCTNAGMTPLEIRELPEKKT